MTQPLPITPPDRTMPYLDPSLLYVYLYVGYPSPYLPMPYLTCLCCIFYLSMGDLPIFPMCTMIDLYLKNLHPQPEPQRVYP